jgi:hypothetical protein
MVSWSRSPLSSTLVLVTFVIWRPRARADTPVSECVCEGVSEGVCMFRSSTLCVEVCMYMWISSSYWVTY